MTTLTIQMLEDTAVAKAQLKEFLATLTVDERNVLFGEIQATNMFVPTLFRVPAIAVNQLELYAQDLAVQIAIHQRNARKNVSAESANALLAANAQIELLDYLIIVAKDNLELAKLEAETLLQQTPSATN